MHFTLAAESYVYIPILLSENSAQASYHISNKEQLIFSKQGLTPTTLHCQGLMLYREADLLKIKGRVFHRIFGV